MDGKDDIARAIGREIGETIAKKIAIGIAILFGFMAFIFVGGIVVQWLWNWLLPDIFGLRRVTFWEALGLLALCRILFGGFGKGAGSHGRSDGGRRSGGDGKPWWKKPKAAAAVETVPQVPSAPPA
jgi:uncharacterized membrane protein YgcG